MRYPTLTIAQVDSLLTDLTRGLDPSCEAIAIWRGGGETISFDAIDVVLATFKAELEKMGSDPSLVADKEPFEGELAVALFPALDQVPIEVLDDPGFWRFLAMSRFWWFVEWRESRSVVEGRALTYIDGRRNTESIPLRLYLRAKSVAGSGQIELAQQLERCADFWRSHITRVRTGTAPHVAAAFAAMQRNDETRLATDELRAMARRLNRLWTNVQLTTYEAVDAAAIIKELRP